MGCLGSERTFTAWKQMASQGEALETRRRKLETQPRGRLILKIQ